MADYTIDVTEIEELQTIKDTDALDRIFYRAQVTVVGGESVFLVRKKKGATAEKFDEISTEEDLRKYRESVYKYL